MGSPAEIAMRELALVTIEKIVFFKHDEVTSDLICCEVEANGRIWFFHEDLPEWDALIEQLERLPGFRGDWFAQVSLPPFAASSFVAFPR